MFYYVTLTILILKKPFNQSLFSTLASAHILSSNKLAPTTLRTDKPSGHSLTFQTRPCVCLQAEVSPPHYDDHFLELEPHHHRQ